MPERRVLIAAGPYDAEFIRRTLHDAGYETALWSTGTPFAQAAREAQVAALVLSQRLEGVVWADLLSALRSEEQEGGRLPVLLISDARCDVSTLADAVRFGADQMLLRPLEPLLLLSKLDAMVAHSGPLTIAGPAGGRRRPGSGRPGRFATLPVGSSVGAEAGEDSAPDPASVAVTTTATPTVLSVEAFCAQLERKRANVRQGSYFALLELPQGASAEQVEQAYLQLLRELDPARVDGELPRELLDTLAEVRGAIEEAFVVLSDDDVREAYAHAL